MSLCERAGQMWFPSREHHVGNRLQRFPDKPDRGEMGVA